MSADEGHYVDEFTVIKEMAMSLGKVIMYILVGLIVFFATIKWAFLLSSIAALLLTFFRARDLYVGDRKISPVNPLARKPF